MMALCFPSMRQAILDQRKQKEGTGNNKTKKRKLDQVQNKDKDGNGNGDEAVTLEQRKTVVAVRHSSNNRQQNSVNSVVPIENNSGYCEWTEAPEDEHMSKVMKKKRRMEEYQEWKQRVLQSNKEEKLGTASLAL